MLFFGDLFQYSIFVKFWLLKLKFRYKMEDNFFTKKYKLFIKNLFRTKLLFRNIVNNVYITFA